MASIHRLTHSYGPSALSADYERSYAELDAAPPQMLKMTGLETLDLRGNRITVIPPEIGQLANLWTLHVHNNRLTAFPAEMTQLIHLTALDFEGNPVTSLP